jgi:hypothetical protein
VRTIDSDSDHFMILRAWVEPHHKPSLRVRIIHMSMRGTGDPVTSAAATVEDACSAVRNWLEQLLAREKPGPPPQCR